MKKLAVHNLQHRIKFLINTVNSEIENEQWEEKFTLYAEIKPVCDNKFTAIDGLNFGHIMTEGFFIFRVRYVKGVHTKMRIAFKDRQFEIRRIINVDERSKFLQIIGLEIYAI